MASNDRSGFESLWYQNRVNTLVHELKTRKYRKKWSNKQSVPYRGGAANKRVRYQEQVSFSLCKFIESKDKQKIVVVGASRERPPDGWMNEHGTEEKRLALIFNSALSFLALSKMSIWTLTNLDLIGSCKLLDNVEIQILTLLHSATLSHHTAFILSNHGQKAEGWIFAHQRAGLI